MRLKEIATLLNGYAFKSKNYVSSGIRIMRIANVQDGYISDEQPCYYPCDTEQEIEKYMLQEGDILVSLTGNVGRIGLLKSELLPAALNQRISCIRLKNDNVSKKYLFYFLRRKQFVQECVTASKGVAQLNLSTKWLADYKVPVPPLEEQERIVARIEELFSSLDNAVETLNKTKEQLAVYRQAVLKDAFSNISEFKTIKEMSSIVTSGSRGWAKYYSDHGAKFIRIGNLTRNIIDIDLSNIQFVDLPDGAEGKRTRLEPNDVLVSITADLGSIGLVTEYIGEAYVNQHIAMIRFLNATQGKFFAWYLRSEWGQKDLLKNKRGAGKLGLGLDDIRDSKIPLITNEQANITLEKLESRLSVCESIEQTVDTALSQAEAMRQTILKEAFEGRLA